MTFVLDASMTMAWCFEDERTEVSEAIGGMLARGADDAVVSGVWAFEVANATLRGLRRNRLTLAQGFSFLQTIDRLPITNSAPATPADLPALVEMARAHGLSAYDAAYLELAMRLSLPLATLDVRLRDAAAQAGVPLFFGDGSQTRR